MRVPLLKFEGGPGILLLNFEEGPGVPLLNFRGVPGPTFKLWGGSRFPGSRGLVPRLHHATLVQAFSCEFCEICVCVCVCVRERETERERDRERQRETERERILYEIVLFLRAICEARYINLLICSCHFMNHCGICMAPIWEHKEIYKIK